MNLMTGDESNGSVAELRELLAFAKHPFLALRPRSAPIRYEYNEGGWRYELTVRPKEPGNQIASQADGDILAYFAGILAQRKNRGERLGARVHARPGEILRAIGRPTDGMQHRRLRAALDRLVGSEVILHPIRRVDRTPAAGAALRADLRTFHHLEEVEPSAPGRRAPWTFVLSDWLVHEVMNLRMRKIGAESLRALGLDRRLHAWARAYAGRADRPSYEMTVETAHRRAGGTTALRQFRHELRDLVNRNMLPEHVLTLVEREGKTWLRIVRRDAESTSAQAGRLGPYEGVESDPLGEVIEVVLL